MKVTLTLTPKEYHTIQRAVILAEILTDKDWKEHKKNLEQFSDKDFWRKATNSRFDWVMRTKRAAKLLRKRVKYSY